MNEILIVALCLSPFALMLIALLGCHSFGFVRTKWRG